MLFKAQPKDIYAFSKKGLCKTRKREANYQYVFYYVDCINALISVAFLFSLRCEMFERKFLQ